MAPTKGVKRPIHQYDEKALTDALFEIREHDLSIREASRRYGVPRGTLQDRLHGRIQEGARRMGPQTVLSQDEETHLVDWLIQLSKCGFPRKKDDLLNTVQTIILAGNRKSPFTDGRPGKKWYSSFLRRHNILTDRVPEGITKGRAIVTEEMIRKWFRELTVYLENINSADILSDPNRIMNGDETSFSMCPKTGKVIAPKGWKNVYELQLGNAKETITVLLVFTASGKTIAPTVVFPYVRPPRDVVESMPPDWFLGRSDSGWMKSEIFYEYVVNGVNKWIDENNIKRPVLLLVDGHRTHLTMELSEYCSNSGIILYALPPNTTHMMQPADVSVFKPLKSQWKKTVREWQIRLENINSVLTKATFCPLLATVLKNTELASTIQNGFRKCGLYPFNPDAVDYTKCIQNTLEVMNRATSETTIQLQDHYFTSAERVISGIRRSLSDRGVNVDVVLEEIHKAQLSSASTSHVPDEQDVTTSAQSVLLDSVPMAIELNNVDFDIEPGVYDVDCDGVLQTSSTPTPISTISDNIKNDHTCGHEELSPVRTENTGNGCADLAITGTGILTSVASVEENSMRSEESSASHVEIQVCDKENSQHSQVVKNTSSHFENHLFWPGPLSSTRKQRPAKERPPSAISSAAWREFYSKKDLAKSKEEELKAHRKQERENRKSQKVLKKKSGKGKDKKKIADSVQMKVEPIL